MGEDRGTNRERGSERGVWGRLGENREGEEEWKLAAGSRTSYD